jgi:hypothetical protein
MQYAERMENRILDLNDISKFSHFQVKKSIIV